MKPAKLFYWSFAGLLALTGLSRLSAEVVGKSMAIVNGEAIYLSEFEDNWDSILEQRQQSGAKSEMTEDWTAKNRKMLLDQMIEEKLLLQEAKKRNVVVPK